MKDLVIVCEDSFGLDVKWIAQEMNAIENQISGQSFYNIKGFIVPNRCSYRTDSMTFLGTIEEKACEPNEVYAMGIVEPCHKVQCVAELKEKGACFVVLRAPWVSVMPTMKYGEGSIIAAHSIKETAKIGNFVTLVQTMLDDGTVVGDYSSVMAYSNLTTSELGEGVYVGPNCVVMEKVKIGAGSHVNPNSVVVRNVRPGITVQGLPAKRV